MATRMMKAAVKVALPTTLEEELLSEVRELVDQDAEEIAGSIATRAKATTAFEDYKGTARESLYSRRKIKYGRKLRKSIRTKKSKFEDGGWLVYSTAPHAHLVEFGHIQVRNNKVLGRVDAHPFLRPAADAEVIAYIKKVLGS